MLPYNSYIHRTCSKNLFLPYLAGIAKFMKRRYGAASTELFTSAAMEEFLKTETLTVVALFEKGSELETFFLKYADNFKEDYRFGHSSAAEVLSKYNKK